MLNLSIMPLDGDRVDEFCEDIINQQRTGATTHALFMMKFQPECTPPLNKAEEECKIYDMYREKLDKAGAKHGVLVQATLGHIVVPRDKHPYQVATSLITGEEMVTTCCPFDPGFQEYIKKQMEILASHNPSIVMIDDDVGLLYRRTKGCACQRHMAEFNRRAGTNMTREQLYAHTQGNSEEDKKYTQIYVDLQRDSLLEAVKAMRAGLDAVNPKIQGVVSGIYTSTFCEFSGDVAEAFAGEGNPSVARLNGGPYAKPGSKYFTTNFFRAAILKENTKDKIDVFLAETDTCPQNRYSTSAAMLHGHFAASILEGAQGAKHWITRLGAYEPSAGKAYRKTLSKYNKFYEKLSEYVKEFKPFGCRIPLTLMQNYGFVPASQGINLSPWSTCFLERVGLPLYFSNDDGGAVFVDDFSVDGFDDERIKEFLSGTAVFSAGAAKKLCDRGFSKYLGVSVKEWEGVVTNGEKIGEIIIAEQYDKKELTILGDDTEVISTLIRKKPDTGEIYDVAPAVTWCKNPLGGNAFVFCGTPDAPYGYNTSFSLLCETRKRQFVDILSKTGNLPIYYTEDVEMYLRAGYLENGEIMAAFFNIGFDQLEDIPFVSAKKVTNIEKLNPDGTRSKCEFTEEGGVIRVLEPLNTLIPAVLFIS